MWKSETNAMWNNHWLVIIVVVYIILKQSTMDVVTLLVKQLILNKLIVKID